MKNFIKKVKLVMSISMICVMAMSNIAYAQISEAGSIEELYSKFDIPYPAQPTNVITAPNGTLDDSTSETAYKHNEGQLFWNIGSKESSADAAANTVYEKAWNYSNNNPVYALGIDRGENVWDNAGLGFTRLFGKFNSGGSSDASIKNDYYHIRGKIGWSMDIKFSMTDGTVPANGPSRDFMSVGNADSNSFNGVGGYIFNWYAASVNSGTVEVTSLYAPSNDNRFAFSKDTWYRVQVLFTSSNMRDSEKGLVETTIYKIDPQTSTFENVKFWSVEIDETSDSVFGVGSDAKKLSEALRLRIHLNEIQRMTIANAYSVHEAYAVEKPLMEKGSEAVVGSTKIALQYVPEDETSVIPAVLVLGAYDSEDMLIAATASELTPTSAWTEGSVELPLTERAQKYRFMIHRAENDLRLYTAPEELNNN